MVVRGAHVHVQGYFIGKLYYHIYFLSILSTTGAPNPLIVMELQLIYISENAIKGIIFLSAEHLV